MRLCIETGSRNEPGFLVNGPGKLTSCVPGQSPKYPGSWGENPGPVRQYPVGFGFFRQISVDEKDLPNNRRMLPQRNDW
jgi:hypothetical protein